LSGLGLSGQDQADHLLSASEAQRRAGLEHWRLEVASRVQQHRARRRRRFDANASFEFDFPTDSALAIASTPPSSGVVAPWQTLGTEDENKEHVEPVAPRHISEGKTVSRPRKIIRFPGTIAPDTATLAHEPEPLQVGRELLRIFDAPEDAPEPQQLELLPAFPDIRLDEDEDEQPEEASLSSLTDPAPQPAPLPQRIFSGMVDLAVLLLAAGFSAVVFFELASGFPSGRRALPCALIVCGAFWFLLQYVFLVYGGRTPGMRAANIELSTFDRQPADARARRIRAWAATLSALSLGLGFLWAFLDEDTLGWHDRISETYLVPLKSRGVQPSDIGRRNNWPRGPYS
jgi:uncharacterized RDD family membrane protein YckC